LLFSLQMMKSFSAWLLAALLLASASPVDASPRAVGVPRAVDGRIRRSAAAKRQFMRQTGYPHGRPGYVVDHIIPLKRGGKDIPANMQWQTKAEAKAKDRWE